MFESYKYNHPNSLLCNLTLPNDFCKSIEEGSSFKYFLLSICGTCAFELSRPLVVMGYTPYSHSTQVLSGNKHVLALRN